MKGLAQLGVRFAPVAWLFGIGFAGYGVGGFLGAGVALMLPAIIVFVGVWIEERVTAHAVRDRRRRKTLRHRLLLWNEQRHRKRERGKRERLERKEAERRFLAARRKTKGS